MNERFQVQFDVDFGVDDATGRVLTMISCSALETMSGTTAWAWSRSCRTYHAHVDGHIPATRAPLPSGRPNLRPRLSPLPRPSLVPRRSPRQPYPPRCLRLPRLPRYRHRMPAFHGLDDLACSAPGRGSRLGGHPPETVHPGLAP